MPDRYTFTAVFDYADDGINITFPDLPGCFSCAAKGDTRVACDNAREALGLHLCCMENDGEIIPDPAPPGSMQLNDGQKTFAIDVFMPPFRVALKSPAAA